MGSELFQTLKAQGRNISRGGGETANGPPGEFTVVGVDISAEKLLALYPDETSKTHVRARAIIRGVVDRTRVKGPPPDEFVASLAGGVNQWPTVANLGPDRKGRIWFLVVIGRQRTVGLRIHNTRNPGDAHDLTCILAPFRHNDKAGIDAEIDALEANAESNVFVAMTESSKADHAARLKSKGRSDAQIAGRVGARDAEHVRQLLALAECSEATQDEVDAGRVLLADALVLCKLTAEEQARRVARKTAGNGKAAKNAAAAPRAKTRRASHLEAIEAAARAQIETVETEDPNDGSDDAKIAAARLEGLAEGMAIARGAGCPSWAVAVVKRGTDAAKAGRGAT